MNKPNNKENVTSSQNNFQNSQTTQGNTSETRPGMQLESGHLWAKSKAFICSGKVPGNAPESCKMVFPHH